jgi:hypothetical protein
MMSKFLLTLFILSIATVFLLIARRALDMTSTGNLFGLPNINLSFTLFNDEVFDVSSISLFGDINDGSSSEAAMTPESDNAVGGQPAGSLMFGRILPWSWPWSFAEPSTNIEVVIFNDEVFDISSISVFGDINDGSSPEAPEVAA